MNYITVNSIATILLKSEVYPKYISHLIFFFFGGWGGGVHNSKVVLINKYQIKSYNSCQLVTIRSLLIPELHQLPFHVTYRETHNINTIYAKGYFFIKINGESLVIHKDFRMDLNKKW